jgi:hypothetical protein
MNTRSRVLPTALALLAVALAQSTSLLAATAVKRAPPGMTVPQFQQRLAQLSAAEKQKQLAVTQRATSRLVTATRAIEPELKAVSAALNADPRYRAFLQQAHNISVSPGDPARRSAQMAALINANRVIYQDAMRTARINPAALQARVGNDVLLAGLTPRLRMSSGNAAQGSVIAGTPAQIPDLVLTQPFDYEDTETENGGLAYTAADPSANADNGKTRSHANIIGVTGGARATSEVGALVSVPAGVKRIEVTVTTEMSYSGAALAVVGISTSNAWTTVTLYSADLDDSFASTSIGDHVVAPIGWFAEMSESRARDDVYSLNVSASQRDFMLVVSSYASSLGGGIPGYSETLAKNELKKVRVRFFKD